MRSELPRLAQDVLGVRLQLCTQLHPGQMGLQQQVGLDVGVVKLGVVQFVGNLLGQLKDRAVVATNSAEGVVIRAGRRQNNRAGVRAGRRGLTWRSRVSS